MTTAHGGQQVPAATYRLQVHAGFGLDDAAEVAGYLADLGVTHAYSSPLLRSAEGSNHGYDTVDHAHIDEARGGKAGFDRFVAALHEHGLGLVLDLVPNHMGVADPAASAWWWDVLQHGQDSAHAAAFDIDWEFGGGKVRLPVLGSADDVAEARRCVDGELRYYDNRFPIAPGTERGHAAGGARPAALRAGRLAARGLRPQLPPVLRDQHPGRAARGGPGDLRRDPRAGPAAGPRRRRRRAADRPSGRAGRPQGLPGPAGRGVRATGGRSWRRSSSPGEDLPESWRTAGTTGYDALAEVDDVLIDPAGEFALTALDTELAGGAVDYARLVRTTASARSPTGCSAPRSPGWCG